jgi:hypothetical protein
MFIITRFTVTDAQRKAIGDALGLRGPAEREQVRDYLQKHGELHLVGLTLPLLRTNPQPRLMDRAAAISTQAGA